LAQSPALGKLYAAPGNPGIARHAELVVLDAADHQAVVNFCRTRSIALVVIGPEAPLVAGLADDLRAADIRVFGPGKAAARLEGSKGFTKDLCREADIPTAGYVRADGPEDALPKLAPFGLPVVIKADGLAAGKGVVIAATRDEAERAVRDAAGPLVIEEFLDGEEASLFALSDGTAVVPFGSAQDHKRVGDGDTGPNTGGMGSFSPVAGVGDLAAICAAVHQPVLDELRSRGIPFHGTLYAGLMLTADGPRVIEFNCRFGDPETQAVLPRMTSDLLALLQAATRSGGLAGTEPPRWREEWAVTVVLASAGYPASSRSGDVIAGLDAVPAGVEVTHAGTARDAEGRTVTAGGRVVNVTGLGATPGTARDAAYAAADLITFEGRQLRTDIARAAAVEHAT